MPTQKEGKLVWRIGSFEENSYKEKEKIMKYREKKRGGLLSNEENEEIKIGCVQLYRLQLCWKWCQ